MLDAERPRHRADPDAARAVLTRDEDVLDTWFSSALWPFSTLGWPDETPELQRYYPTNTLVTGFDIIFFWVARMMMMGLHFMKEVPFHTVYIHALVRDETRRQDVEVEGQRHRSARHLIDEYGADALRFTLAAMAAQGRDIKLSTAARRGLPQFRDQALERGALRRDERLRPRSRASIRDGANETLNRWIAHETAKAAREITAAIEAYQFNEAAGAVYRFVWNVYCDWYLELAKPVLTGAGRRRPRTETRAMVAWVRDEILKLLHPFMPFITEELWRVTAERRRARKPAGAQPLGRSTTASTIAEAEAEIGWVIDLITAIRSVRAEMNIPAGALIPLVLIGVLEPRREARAGRWADFIKRLARCPTSPSPTRRRRARCSSWCAARSRRCRSRASSILPPSRRGSKKKWPRSMPTSSASTPSSAIRISSQRAPEEVIEGEREKREEAEARRAKILEALERLKGAA